MIDLDPWKLIIDIKFLMCSLKCYKTSEYDIEQYLSFYFCVFCVPGLRLHYQC